MQLNPDLQQRLSMLLLRLCTRSPFFGSLALFARIEGSEQVPTAATDGRDIFINPAYFSQLSPAEQEAVLLHEVLHAALLHVSRGKGREAKRWNIAADIVVNGILAREGYTLPEHAVGNPWLEQLSTEEVYDLLAQPKRHGIKVGQLADPDLLSQRPGDCSPAEEAAYQASPEDYWRNAQEQANIMVETAVAGNYPAYLQRELSNLSPAQLNWRHYLWRYLVRTPIDFSGFDRRFVWQGLYLDTLDGESVRVIVGVDTSGSISKKQLQAFLSEVQEILRAYPHLRCDLYYIDTEAHGPYRLTINTPVPTPVGGGGTDFRPFFEQITRAYDYSAETVAVYLTDGYGLFPENAPAFPVLWVVTPGGLDLVHFPFGETVRLAGV
ncbi:MAG: hydrolase [Chloroflexota bacterium]|nr:MAG: hydrolase [Chloroflexota bacterium]